MTPVAAIRVAVLLIVALTAQSGWAQLEGVVRPVDGRPLIVAGEQVLTSSYSERFPRGPVQRRIVRFAKAGVDLFQLDLHLHGGNDLYTTPFWTDDGVYADDERATAGTPTLDQQANWVRQLKPDAVFAVSFFAAPPLAWAKRHPDHMQQGARGKQYRGASYASALWLEGQLEMARRVVRYVQSRPWGDRNIGFFVIPHYEGVTEAAFNGDPFDQSPVMREAFRDYLRKKYATDEALRAAWSRPSASLSEVTTPTIEQWHADRKTWLTFTADPRKQPYLDYFALQRDLMHRFVTRLTQTIKSEAGRDVIVALDGFKQAMAGWLPRDAFFAQGDGMSFPNILLASGLYDVAQSLDVPTLDGLMTPADYSARSVGWGYDAEGIADSLVLRGKTMLLENDARNWNYADVVLEQGAHRNAKEGRAGLRRNFALAASRGMFSHWANSGRGFFDDDQVMQLVSEVVPMRRQMMTAPLPHTEHAIAMIIDDTSPRWTDFTTSFYHLAVLRQRVDQLAMTGLPYRVYLFSDLQRDDFPRFRAYLFPDLVELTPQRVDLLRRKVLRFGSVAIFGPATGISDGRTITAAPASELFGMSMQLVHKRAARRVLVHAGAHPALVGVSHPVTYGDSYSYGPILLPPHALPRDIVELGKASVYYGANTAGLILRDIGQDAGGMGENDACIVFSTAAPMPASLLRSLAVHAGCNPWSELGDVVYASGNFLAVHSVRSGKRTLSLPVPAKVTDLSSGKMVVENMQTFTVELDAPETLLFRWEKAVPEESRDSRLE